MLFSAISLLTETIPSGRLTKCRGSYSQRELPVVTAVNKAEVEAYLIVALHGVIPLKVLLGQDLTSLCRGVLAGGYEAQIAKA